MQARRQRAQARIDRAEAGSTSEKLHSLENERSLMRSLERASKRWSPIHKQIIIAAVSVRGASEDGPALPQARLDPQRARDVVRGAEAQMHAIAHHWGRTFGVSPTQVGADAARALCWAAPWRWDLFSPPPEAAFTALLRRARNSKPGPDGIPYAAGAASGQNALHSLALDSEWLARGHVMPLVFNEAEQVFAPEGVQGWRRCRAGALCG